MPSDVTFPMDDISPAPLKAKLPFPNQDIEEPRRLEAPFRLPAALQRVLATFLKDERDVLLVETMISIAVIVAACVGTIFMVESTLVKVLLGLAYVPCLFIFLGARFILALHYWSHAPGGTIFASKSPLAFAVQAIPTLFIAPWFGIPAGLYHLHHIAMHHRDNNIFPHDLSSTMPYQRDSLLGFSHYWARYLFGAWVELPLHSLRSGNMKLFGQGVACSLGFWVSIFALWSIDPVATVFTFILPFIVASLALMFGNWSQHIFINPDAYDDNAIALNEDDVNYSLTYNAINSADNSITFNDGYHIVHHRWASLHWSKMPQKFMDDIDRHAANDALVFKGVSPHDVGFAVMTGNYGLLTKAYVHYGQTPKPRTDEEIIAELKRRLTPIVAKPKSA